MMMEGKLPRKNLHKITLIKLKFSPHIYALAYVIYTALNFFGIDCNIVGCFFHISLLVWIDMLLASLVFKFCYVHRLPLYYVLANELITCLDYYLKLPTSVIDMLVIHLLLIILLIFGYTFYYLRNAR